VFNQGPSFNIFFLLNIFLLPIHFFNHKIILGTSFKINGNDEKLKSFSALTAQVKTA